MTHPVVEGRQVARQFQDAGGPHGVSDETLGVVEQRGTALAERATQGKTFLHVAGRGSRGVRADDVDLVRVDSGPPQRQFHALGLPIRMRKHKVIGVAIHRVADDLAVDPSSSSARVRQSLEHEQAPPFRNDNAVAIRVERARGLGRVFVAGQGPLAVETGKDAERANALRHPAANRQVALAQAKHLHALDDSRIARRTGRPQRVVRPGDPEVQRDLSGRVIGHRSRIVMVRPELRVVAEFFELVDLVFGLDVAVFGHADVNSHVCLVDIVPINAGIVDGLMRAVDSDAPRPGAAAQLFSALMPQLIEGPKTPKPQNPFTCILKK